MLSIVGCVVTDTLVASMLSCRQQEGIA